MNKWIILAVAAVITVLFQNCGSYYAATGGGEYAESSFSTAPASLGSPSLGVWVSGKDSTMTKSSAAVLSLNSLRTDQFVMTPRSGLAGPDVTASTILAHPVLNFTGNKNLQTSPSDFLASDGYSIVALIERPASGRVFSINGGSFNREELAMSIDATKLLVWHQTNGPNRGSYSFNLPSGSGPLVLAISFGKEPRDIQAQFNGVTVTAPYVAEGTPLDNPFISRQVMIGDPGGTVSFKMAELMVFSQVLAPTELNLLSRFLGQKWGVAGIGSSTPIPLPPITPPADPLFTQTKAIIQAKCLGCHAIWANYSVDAFVSDNLVVRGNAFGSKLYARLSVAEGGAGPRNMPMSGSLSSAEGTTIKNWINGLR